MSANIFSQKRKNSATSTHDRYQLTAHSPWQPEGNRVEGGIMASGSDNLKQVAALLNSSPAGSQSGLNFSFRGEVESFSFECKLYKT